MLDTALKRSMIIGERGGCQEVCQHYRRRFAIGDCLIFFIPPTQTTGLFSVPAPSLHLGERRGFLLAW
jgi:hypothetical protein